MSSQRQSGQTAPILLIEDEASVIAFVKAALNGEDTRWCKPHPARKACDISPTDIMAA